MKSDIFLMGIFWTISSVIGPPSQDGGTTEVVEVIEWNRGKYAPRENRKYPALIIDGDGLKISENIHTEFEEAFACPSKKEYETLPNSRECITKNCLVIKKTVPNGERESEKICTEQYAPSMIWNTTTSSVETGYEIRFLETEFVRDKYLRELKDTSKAFAGIIDNMIPQPHEIRKAKKSKNILKFIWKSVLQIQFDTELNIPRQVKFERLRYETATTEDECSNYNIIKGLKYQIENLNKYYTPENQRKMLALPRLFLTEENFFGRTGRREISKTSDICGLPGDCMVQKQLVPYFYFGHRAYKQATCTQLNTVPIWESIAGKGWRRLENFLLGLFQYRDDVKIITGTAGILQLPIENSGAQQNIFLNTEKQTIAVPKLVYKLVTHTKRDQSDGSDYEYAIVIIIHNDPTLLAWGNTVCEKSICTNYGWKEIENQDYQTGLIYCCEPSRKVLRKLEMSSNDVSSYAQYRTFSLNGVYEYDKYDRRTVVKKFEITSLGNDKYSFREIKL